MPIDLEPKLEALRAVVRDHREVLLTEEAAKTALVMPFLQALGYNVFNPSEVVPEFTADVGTKKGEKVDYAVCIDGKVEILIECKPANVELSIEHAAQLFRYFSVTETRVAVLTNGVVYKFFSDTVKPNRMDEQPFFVFQLDAIKKRDIVTLASFSRLSFNIDKIVAEAASLKSESLVYRELQNEFSEPSDEFVRLIASRVVGKPVTQGIRDNVRALIVSSVAALIRDRVNERLTSALTVTNPIEGAKDSDPEIPGGPIVKSEDEVAGYCIVRAIASKLVDPRRIIMRDAQTYCAILLDGNNRKPIVRLRFNSPTSRHLGVFAGKEEVRHRIMEPVEIYQHDDAILARISELLI